VRLAIVGGGVMGEAIIAAVLQRRLAQPTDITACDVVPQRREHLSRSYGITTVEGATDALLRDPDCAGGETTGVSRYARACARLAPVDAISTAAGESGHSHRSLGHESVSAPSEHTARQAARATADATETVTAPPA
jgi:predicted dehydrogenase